MFGSESAFNPAAVLAMWSAGIAGAGGIVAYWRIVGPGYLWLTAGTVTVIGGSAWFFESGPLLGIACLLGMGAALVARRPRPAVMLLGASSLLFLLGAMTHDVPIPAITGGLALGGITAEMLLGHWYLVDPRIPRWPLRRLAAAGMLGVALDGALHLFSGFPSAGSSTVVTALVLAGMSVLLMAGVWFSLGYPSYPGVMAATGLSYLAVLTSLGSVMLVRALTAGVSPFR